MRVPGHFNYCAVGAEQFFTHPRPLLGPAVHAPTCLWVSLPRFGGPSTLFDCILHVLLPTSASSLLVCVSTPSPTRWSLVLCNKPKVEPVMGGLGCPAEEAPSPERREPTGTNGHLPSPRPHLKTYLEGVLGGAPTALHLTFIHFYPHEDTYLGRGRKGLQSPSFLCPDP